MVVSIVTVFDFKSMTILNKVFYVDPSLVPVV